MGSHWGHWDPRMGFHWGWGLWEAKMGLNWGHWDPKMGSDWDWGHWDLNMASIGIRKL